ncbi:hypothetical protein EI555_001703, partial [Monodon monoceros]
MGIQGWTSRQRMDGKHRIFPKYSVYSGPSGATAEHWNLLGTNRQFLEEDQRERVAATSHRAATVTAHRGRKKEKKQCSAKEAAQIPDTSHKSSHHELQTNSPPTMDCFPPYSMIQEENESEISFACDVMGSYSQQAVQEEHGLCSDLQPFPLRTKAFQSICSLGNLCIRTPHALHPIMILHSNYTAAGKRGGEGDRKASVFRRISVYGEVMDVLNISSANPDPTQRQAPSSLDRRLHLASVARGAAPGQARPSLSGRSGLGGSSPGSGAFHPGRPALRCWPVALGKYCKVFGAFGSGARELSLLLVMEEKNNQETTKKELQAMIHKTCSEKIWLLGILIMLCHLEFSEVNQNRKEQLKILITETGYDYCLKIIAKVLSLPERQILRRPKEAQTQFNAQYVPESRKKKEIEEEERTFNPNPMTNRKSLIKMADAFQFQETWNTVMCVYVYGCASVRLTQQATLLSRVKMASRPAVAASSKWLEGIHKWYYNVVGFSKLGLMRDDTIYENDDVKEAIRKLPENLYND